MTDCIVVTGMILSAQPIGEFDRRLVILTKEKGKISAFAKGARRQTAALLGITQPFVFGRFTLFEGRSSYTFQSAEVQNYFAELREDLMAVSYGFYFCEFAETVTREGMQAGEELKILYRSLCALKKDSIGKSLVRAVFEFKMLTVGGLSPQVFECIDCGKKDELLWFSAKEGGCICSACRRKDRYKNELGENLLLSLHPSSLYTLQYIESTKIETLYTFTVTNEVLTELRKLLSDFLLIHIGRKFKSLSLVDQLTEMEESYVKNNAV